MGWQEINFEKYTAEVKKNFKLSIADEIIKKDLLLTFILAELEKAGLGKELIFKGGTLLSRNYLNYHRFSEDLDFVHKDSGDLRQMTRANRERKIKNYIDFFTPKLKEAADALGLEFSIDRSNKKFCKMLNGRAVYTFKLYYSDVNFIKVEINFVEKLINKPEKVSIKSITDFFDSKTVLYELGLSYQNFNVLSYSIEEIKLEKYRAILTRNKFQERDLFDLFLIKNSLKIDLDQVVEKMVTSSLIKKDLSNLIKNKLKLLEEGNFFESDEKIERLAIQLYKESEFEGFKDKIKPLLIEICKKFLAK